MSLFLFLFGFLLPTQFGKHFWPAFTIIDGLRIDYLSPTLYVSDVISFFIILYFFYLQWKIRKELRHGPLGEIESHESWKKVLFIVVCFFLFLSIGIYFSYSPLAGWYWMLKLVECILLGFSLKTFFENKKLFNTFSYGLFFAVIFQSMLAIWQVVVQGSVGGLFYYFGERFFTADTPGIANASINGSLMLRPYATLPHPNVLAGFLFFAMILLWNTSLFGRKKILIFLPFYLLATIALLFTLSRVVIVLWVVFLGWQLYLLVGKKSLSFKTMAIVCGSIFLLSVVFFSPLYYRFFFLSLQDESIAERMQLMSMSWDMIKSNPILGVGLHNNLFIYSNFSRTQLQIFTPQPVHNIFFLIAVETGIPGLLFFLWFLFVTWKKVWRKNSLLSFLLFSFCCIGLVDHYFLTLQQGQLLMVVVFAWLWSE